MLTTHHQTLSSSSSSNNNNHSSAIGTNYNNSSTNNKIFTTLTNNNNLITCKPSIIWFITLLICFFCIIIMMMGLSMNQENNNIEQYSFDVTDYESLRHLHLNNNKHPITIHPFTKENNPIDNNFNDNSVNDNTVNDKKVDINVNDNTNDEKDKNLQQLIKEDENKKIYILPIDKFKNKSDATILLNKIQKELENNHLIVNKDFTMEIVSKKGKIVIFIERQEISVRKVKEILEKCNFRNEMEVIEIATTFVPLN